MIPSQRQKILVSYFSAKKICPLVWHIEKILFLLSLSLINHSKTVVTKLGYAYTRVNWEISRGKPNVHQFKCLINKIFNKNEPLGLRKFLFFFLIGCSIRKRVRNHCHKILCIKWYCHSFGNTFLLESKILETVKRLKLQVFKECPLLWISLHEWFALNPFLLLWEPKKTETKQK